jgi:hypothetical protein
MAMRVCSVIMVCCAVFGVTTTVRAQGSENGKPPVAIGVKGGLSVANVSIEAEGITVSMSSRTGYIVGGFVEMPIGPNLAVQPEFLLTTKGTSYSYSGYVDDLKLTYLDVPVLVKYKVARKGTNIVPYVFGGPTIGLLLSATETTTYKSTTTDSDVKSAMNSLEVGLTFGGGVQVGKVMVEGRYTVGLTNIVSTEELNGIDGSAKNRALAIMAGVRF